RRDKGFRSVVHRCDRPSVSLSPPSKRIALSALRGEWASLPLANLRWFGALSVDRGKRKGEKGPASSRGSVHAAVTWPITGVKIQPEPFATIDRARSTSTVSLVVAPDRISNGVTAFTSPEGTLNTTFVPPSIRPVAAMTTSRISVYLPGPTRALASSSDTFTRDARSIDA